MNSKVDAYLGKQKQWREEMERLRAIALDCGLTEELKWGKPCYCHAGGNVAILQGFKNFCAIMFFKGVLLKDPKGVLQSQGENTQSALRIPFTGVEEVDKMEPVLRKLLREAIEVEEAGLEVEFKKKPDPMPEELKEKLEEDANLKAAFEALTPGRQRGYILHFSQAKQSKTRAARVDKCRERILAGKGLQDR